MKTLLISGSPRKGGNTEQIIERCAELLDGKTEVALCSSLKISACVACGTCKQQGRCFMDDDANSINEKMADSDAIVVATPVYFGSMTAQLKAVLDRTLPLRKAGFMLKGKPGCALAVGGSRNGGQEVTIKDIHAWMLIHGMLVVGDSNHFGGTLHAPWEKDECGIKTLEDSMQTLKEAVR